MTEYYPRNRIQDPKMTMKPEDTGTSPILFQSRLLVEGAVLSVDKNLTFTNGSNIQGYMKIETNRERHTMPSTP
jgi:ABC-type uncharacterized transport system YnjBCD ATPase subunit